MKKLLLLLILIQSVYAIETSLTYDANGNLVTGDGFYREYNSLNQLWKIRNGSSASGVLLQEFLYPPIEERVWMKKTYNTSGVVIETVYYWNKNFITIVNLSGSYNVTYIYIEGQLIAQNVNGVKTFFATDHKGNIVALTNSTGGLVATLEYTPTGELRSNGNYTRYEYEGKETNLVTSTIDFGFRHYNPQNYLFEQPDTFISNVFDPQSLNHFSFERNSPYNKIDPTGHKEQPPDDPIEYGSVYSALVAKYSRRFAAQQELYTDLLAKYFKENPPYMGSCIGCSDQQNKAPSFATLEKAELKNNVYVVIDTKNNIKGYVYKSRYLEKRKDFEYVLVEMGFNKNSVKKDIRNKLSNYERTGNTKKNKIIIVKYFPEEDKK